MVTVKTGDDSEEYLKSIQMLAADKWRGRKVNTTLECKCVCGVSVTHDVQS